MGELLEALGSARVFDLEQLRYAGAPSHPSHVPGFNYFLHRHHARGAPEARTSASGLVVMPEHSGTHIDALAHQAENLTLHGGVDVDPFAREQLVVQRLLEQRVPERVFPFTDRLDSEYSVREFLAGSILAILLP